MKTLVVYFSRKGYVACFAREKAEEMKADLLEIKTTERTKGILGFWWCGRFGMHRWGMPLEKADRKGRGRLRPCYYMHARLGVYSFGADKKLP